MMEPRKFFLSPYYLGLLSAITLCVWYFQLETYGLPLFLLILFVIFVFFKDVTPAVPVLLNALFMISRTEWSLDTIPLYLYLTPVAIILGMLIHVLRFRVKFFRGKMTFGIALMFVAMLLSTINAEFVDINYVFYALIGVVYAFVYFFFVNSMEGDRLEFLLQMLFALGILVSLEVLLYYLRVDDIIYALENKTINLGWGISNYVATYLIIFIPATFYFAKKTKIDIPLIFIALFETIMLVFTLSRGGIIAFSVELIMLLAYLFANRNWFYSLGGFLIAIGILVLIAFLNADMFLAMFDRFKRLLLDDTGRLEIWAQALQVFKEQPLFGAGIFSRLDEFGNFRMYHNTVLHVMASFGIIGLVSLLVQVFMMFKIALTRINQKTIVITIALLGAQAHGMVDNIYLMPQFMILLFIIVAFMENTNKLYLPIMTAELAAKGKKWSHA